MVRTHSTNCIEMCSTCNGYGSCPVLRKIEPDQCPVCEGSGLLNKITTTEYRPYRPPSLPSNEKIDEPA